MAMVILQTAAAIVVGLGLLLAAGWSWQRWAEADQRRRVPAPGQLVDVGGRKLHLRCKGDAPGPTVVIEQGAGGPSFFWWAMQDEVARSARVVTYDRAGYGWSDPTPGPRDMNDRVRDLHAMLKGSGLPGPYILVGHSYGGPLISLFARDHREDVAGLVFADTPDMQSLLGPGYQTTTRKTYMPFFKALRLATRFGLMRLWAKLFPKLTLFAGLPPEPKAAALATRRVSGLDAAVDDFSSLCTIADADRAPLAPGALGGIPVAVISHGVAFPGRFAVLEEDFDDSQARLAALSTNSLHVTLPEAGHIVQVDAPEEVRDIILRVHAAARDGTRLDGAPFRGVKAA